MSNHAYTLALTDNPRAHTRHDRPTDRPTDRPKLPHTTDLITPTNSVSANDGLLLDADAYKLLKDRLRQRKASGGGKAAKGQGGTLEYVWLVWVDLGVLA